MYKLNLELLKYYFEENTHLIKYNWDNLSCNKNAIHLLKNNLDKINWFWLSENPNIFEINYNYIKNITSKYKEELIQKALHPNRIIYWLNNGLSIDDLF